jgi:hypothetical protein
MEEFVRSIDVASYELGLCSGVAITLGYFALKHFYHFMGRQ